MPQGHLLIVCGRHEEDGTGATGIRWSFSDFHKAQMQGLLGIVTDVMKSYPSLAQTDYKSWKEALQEHFLPLAPEGV